METFLKILIVCCVIALTGLCATKEVKADGRDFSTPPSNGNPKVGCVGQGRCGITKNGTLLIGKWREI